MNSEEYMKLSRLKHYIKLYMPYKWVLEYEEKRDFFAQYFAWKETNPQVEFDKECKFDTIVAVQGLGYSGSGAIIDLLREYDDCLVHGMAEGGSKAQPAADDFGEILLLKDIGGLMDLDSVIDTPAKRYGDAALKRFAYRASHDVIYRLGGKYKDYIFAFFDALVEEVRRNIPGSIAGLTPRIRDNQFTMHNYTKDEYYRLCQHFLYSLFNLQYNGNCRYLVLDQAVPVTRLGMKYCKNFIPNMKNIVVWRDPRDRYVIAKQLNISWMPHDTVEQFIEHTKISYANLDTKATDYLAVRFEDLILDYDKTVGLIEKYIGLGEHKRPQSCLDTSISCKNIGTWKTADDIPQEDFEKIYEELKEYCYE